jgi:hypothetical protein
MKVGTIPFHKLVELARQSSTTPIKIYDELWMPNMTEQDHKELVINTLYELDCFISQGLLAESSLADRRERLLDDFYYVIVSLAHIKDLEFKLKNKQRIQDILSEWIV